MKRDEYELRQDNFYYDIDLDEKRNILDGIINEEIQRYNILELGYKKPEDIYLNEDTQKEIIKNITYRVFTLRMTPAVLSTLEYYYTFSSNDELLKIIADHVSMAVLNLTLSTNTTSINIPL